MWNDLLVVIALVLVFEGVIPFLAPEKFRQAMAQLSQLSNQVIRIIGLVSMTLGIIFLTIIKLIK